ncbi:hypothetical protein AGMMS50262_16870 [Bacteroidia bacterium]|nr:hypothetical protein AGMMS50262_16870 [Bacteroidia bacterium]
MSSIYAQNPKWAEVEAFEKQSLPQSALEVVNQIYQDAVQKSNSSEMIKALIYQLKCETAINSDQLPDRIREIEQQADAGTRPVEKAVLSSLTAELYAKYYQADSYKINRRTPVVGYVPEDIREWTSNLFLDKIADLVRQSLTPADKLQATNVLDYKEILLEGSASRTLRPTLFDFLAYRGIDILSQNNDYQQQNFYRPILDLYRQLTDFQKKTNNEQAYVITELDRLEFVRRNSRQDTDKSYIDALNRLEEQYRSKDFCVEIIYKKAIYYLHFDNEATVFSERQKRAYEICTSGIKQYPNYERIGLLQNLLAQTIESHVNIASENTVYPGKELELKINHQNVPKLTVEIYKKNGKLVEKREIKLINSFPFLSSDTIVKIPMKEVGSYEYIAYTGSTQQDTTNIAFSVSRLATISRIINGQWEFLVVDKLSGKPIEGAKLNFYQKQEKSGQLLLKKSLPTNALGLAVLESNASIQVYNASYGDDTTLPVSPMQYIPGNSNNASGEGLFQMALLTDRALYRPGQTLYFKGIAYQLGAKKQEVIPNKTYTVTLRDANYQEIAAKSFTTNEFGSIQGEFVIPQGRLSGTFTLRSDDGNGTAYVQVEEYKRPTFDIQFLPNEETYRFGDSITVKGNAITFSGVNLQEIDVRYRITRQPHWLYRGRYHNPEQIAEGTVQTQADGSFSIGFRAEKTFQDTDNNSVYYNYTIEAELTDSKGETQNSLYSISVGDKSMFLTFSGLDDIVTKEKLPAVQINAANLNGKAIPASGTYELFVLKPKDKTQFDVEADNWLIDKSVYSGSFEAGKALDLTKWQNLASGRYRIIVKAKDQQDREVENQQDFTPASEKDKRPPVTVYDWILTPKLTCAVGEKAEIIYGSSAKDVYVLYEFFQGRKKISASRFVLNNENKKLEIPYLEDYGDGIGVHFMFVKDGKVYEKSVTIHKKQENKNLKIETKVFRDRLLPGQKEEWTFSIKDANNQPVNAEFLTSMYDASLDKLRAHSWNFRPVRQLGVAVPYSQLGVEFQTSRNNIYFSTEEKTVNVPDFRYDQFNWFGFYVRNNLFRSGQMMKSMDYPGAVQQMENESVDIADLQDQKVIIQEEKSTEIFAHVETPPVQIRQNFSETAFFYPQLKTNEAGETLISFTVPESNTTWNFMGLAHTADLKYGQILRQAVSQKPLMVSPNLPRFLREGDRTTIVSDISNLSDKPLTGTVSLESFDPNTNQSNITIVQASQPFSMEAGKTVSVRWTFDIPAGMDLTALKIVAQAGDFSDGEQHLLSVLPNRMLVTESLPLNVLQGQTRTFTFDKKASTTLKNYRLTLEFASNPAWYAIQALPTITAPQNDNVIDWFAAYYSNTLAAHVANSTPKIKQIIDIWTKQGGTKETLLSNLEKNQELKAALLEETPWVLDAKNETEQKQRLSLLFNFNHTQRLNEQAVEKLRNLQAEDGGFLWFKGMTGSVSITQWVLYGMGELAHYRAITDKNPLEDNQLRAIDFIDRAFKKHFEELKKDNPKWKEKQSISTYELEYLLARSFYKDVPLGENTEIVQFYTGLANQYWTKTNTLYDRAITAMILQRDGNTKTAQAIIKSLREHATRKPGFGMFWANNATNCFITQSATCVHTFIMQAFDEVGATPHEMNEMRLWLLKQKQTQRWENVPATVNAIAVLLKAATPLLESTGDVQIRVGNQTLNTQQGEAGTGYFKQVWNAQEITQEMHTVSVSKADAGPTWGALYWQYFEELDKITASKTELNVEKKLFVEKITPSGKTLVPVTEANPLKIGDKLTVRLTVRTDRDLEYVLLKDMRASALEPVEQLSGVEWKQGLVYYRSSKDASTNFYFSVLPKGTYVFEYQLYATHAGEYSNGITTIQCMYAPEYVSHTAGGKIIVQSTDN